MKYLLVLFFLSFITTHLPAATIVVEPGSGKSISKAVEKALPFDTVIIKKGLYYESNVNIDKPLTIIGQDYPVLDSRGGEGIFYISSDHVVVRKIHFQNIGVSHLKDWAAVRVVKSSNVIIDDNRFYKTYFGIYLQNCKRSIVRNNKVIGKYLKEVAAGNAIHIWKGDSIKVLNNYVEGHRDGIYFEFVNNSLVSGNTSLNNLRYGLHFMFSNNDNYKKNIFKNNGAGVAVMFSKNIQMKKNIFEESRGDAAYGILLKEISGGEMENNIFRNNTTGLYAEGASRINIWGNEFLMNGKAIDIKGNCLDNVITGNNFIANTFEVITNTKYNQNLYEGNYWGHYQGYDLDKDGTGDIPYRPVNLFAIITNKIPAASILLNSFLMNVMAIGESVFPYLIPETLVDEKPLMKPIAW